jgi:hypothetical protein
MSDAKPRTFEEFWDTCQPRYWNVHAAKDCWNFAIDAACARMKEAYEANDGVMTLEEAAAEVAKLRTEPPR